MIGTQFPVFLRFALVEIRPWSKFWCHEIRRRFGPRIESSQLSANYAQAALRASARGVAAAQSPHGRRVQAVLGTASSRRRCEIVNEIAASVRVRSASASRLSGVRRLPPKQPPKQQPPRQPSSTRRGSVRQRSSGWQHSSSAHVHSLSARDVPCRYGLQ